METKSVTMRGVVEARIQAEVLRGKERASNTWIRAVEQARNMVDYLLPIGKGGRAFFEVIYDVREGESGQELHTFRPMIMLHNKQGDLIEEGGFRVHDNAWSQLGSIWKIPGSFLRDGICSQDTWRNEPMRAVLNGYAGNHEQKVVLMRTVNGQVRAILSDQYRRMDTVQVFNAFIQNGRHLGYEFCDGRMDDLRSSLTAIRPEVVEVPIGAGYEPLYLAFGARIKTSDFGQGSLEVSGYYMQGACLNGVVIENKLRSVHLGAKITDEDIISLRTVKKQTEAAVSAVHDVSKYIFSNEFRENTVRSIQRAANMEVDMEKEVTTLKKFTITEEEAQRISSLIIGGRYEDGMAVPASVWKCSQAISAIAREDDGSRGLELQEIAGNYLQTRTRGRQES